MKVLERCEECHSGKWESEPCPYCSGWIREQLLVDEYRRSQQYKLVIREEDLVRSGEVNITIRKKIPNVYRPDLIRKAPKREYKRTWGLMENTGDSDRV